jgi:hypothetical protein
MPLTPQKENSSYFYNDDFLGEETLERFYNSATANKSDIIYGKYVGVNGRKVPQSMFKKGNRLTADILEDNLVFSLAPHKMFRLSFLRENGFEFHPNSLTGLGIFMSRQV